MFFLSNKQKAVFAFLAASLLSVAYISLNWTRIIDDAYIYFRYAHNIAQGYGYVFNIGYPAEGTTSVTWTFLLVGLDILHVPMEVSVKILGGLCVGAIVCLLAIEYYRRDAPISIVLLAFSLLVFDRNFSLSMMVGLETGLYSLLLLAFCIVSRWYSDKGGRLPSMVLGGIGVLLFLTRPESVAILALTGCGIVYFRQNSRSKYSLIPILIWILGVSAATLWRWSEFGDFIPNSVRAKSVILSSGIRWSLVWPRIVAGSLYVKDLFMASWLLIALGGVGLASIRKSFWAYVAFSALMTGVAAVLMNSGDWMPRFRLLTAYLPITALLAVMGLSKLLVSQKGRWARGLKWFSILVAILITVNSLWLLRGNAFMVAAGTPSCYAKMGQVLRPHMSEQTTVAPEAIGQTGYALINSPILDFFGLTDPYIARNGVIPIETYTLGKHHYEYVMRQRPALFLFHSHISNHIPFLNQWGYSEEYTTFSVTDTVGKCGLLVGVENSLVPILAPVLNQDFNTQIVDTKVAQKNPAGTWPDGER
jgi:heme/copper-type cytochrome/quinol oxidase subunit 4